MKKKIEDTISVIVPIYNKQKYIDISIPSILNQSYKKIEILLVNDGSTDQSLEIIKKYAGLDQRIKIITKPNGGLVDATIEGIKHATGEFIAFLDPDDRWGENFLQILINEMEEDCDFVAAGIYYENGETVIPLYLEQNRKFALKEIEWLRTHYLLGEKSSLPSTALFHARWNKIYRKTCIDKMVDEFGKYRDITLGEDTIFTYLMLCNCNGGKSLSQANYYYYNIGNQQSMMNTDTASKYIEKVNTVYSRYLKLMDKHGDNSEQANMLYYMLIMSLINKCKNNKDKFISIYKIINKDILYKNVLKYFYKRECNLKRKVALYLRMWIESPELYLKIFPTK